MSKSNEDSEFIIGLGQFGNFPIFLDVKSFQTRNHFFLRNRIYINFTEIRNFRSNEILEIIFVFILSIQKSLMVPNFEISNA